MVAILYSPWSEQMYKMCLEDMLSDIELNEKNMSLGRHQHRINEDDLMSLNLRGQIFVVNTKRLNENSSSTLYELSKTWKENNDRNALFIDRNPGILHNILDYHVTGELHLPESVCGQHVKRELMFWGVGMASVSPCCLEKLKKDSTKANNLVVTLKAMNTREKKLAGKTGVRARICAYYLDPFSTTPRKVVFVFMVLLYLTFLMFLTMASMSEYREPISRETNGTAIFDTYLDEMRKTISHYWIRVGEMTILSVFTLAIFTLIIINPYKKSLWYSFSFIVGTIGMLLQWFPVSMNLLKEQVWLETWPSHLIIFVNWLQVGRILPLFQTLSHFRSIQVIWKALVKSKKELTLLTVLILLSSGVFGYLVYMFEITVVNTQFRSVPDGFWWGLVTLTTLGYGDFYPQGGLGRVIGGCCAVVGILVVALPVPVIAGNFTEIYHEMETADWHRELLKKAEEKGNKDELLKIERARRVHERGIYI